MNILFMGTPDFAVASLAALYEAGHEICGVFTRTDTPKNRGMKLAFSPVKEYAITHNIPVFQPEKLKDEATGEILYTIAPELISVVAYGKLLPSRIIDYPKYGCINVHASILPKYRGAAPIQWSVLNGDAETGVTTMHIAEQLDTGDIIDCLKTPIDPYETSGELTARLMALGGRLLVKTVGDLEAGTAKRTPQEHDKATFAPMLTRELSPIDWNKSAAEILNQVRGLQPWPAATAEIIGTSFKILSVTPTGAHTDAAPGTLLSAQNGIEIACGAGESVMINELQAQGGKRMKAADYLRGHSLI